MRNANEQSDLGGLRRLARVSAQRSRHQLHDQARAGRDERSCPPPLTTLTPSRTQVLAAIDALSADGFTYIPAGLTWGWATLTTDVPFSEPVNPNRKLKRHLVLMTDGENTRSPSYPHHDWTDTATSDNLMSELCINIKAQDIDVFTIALRRHERNDQEQAALLRVVAGQVFRRDE